MRSGVHLEGTGLRQEEDFLFASEGKKGLVLADFLFHGFRLLCNRVAESFAENKGREDGGRGLSEGRICTGQCREYIGEKN